MDYSQKDEILERIKHVESELEKKQNKIPVSVSVTVILVLCAQVFGYGVLYNKVDTAMANRYTSNDAVRDIALVDSRFQNIEEDIQQIDDWQEEFRKRIRELERRAGD